MSLLTKQFRSIPNIRKLRQLKKKVKHYYCIVCQISYLSHFAIGAFK